MSMRSAASCGHPLQLSSVPRGARTSRALIAATSGGDDRSSARTLVRPAVDRPRRAGGRLRERLHLGRDGDGLGEVSEPTARSRRDPDREREEGELLDLAPPVRHLDVPEVALSGGGGAQAAEPVDGLFAQNLTLEEVKKRYISHLLSSTKGNMVRTAAILDVDRRSLYRLVARYHLGAPSLHRQGGAMEST